MSLLQYNLFAPEAPAVEQLPKRTEHRFHRDNPIQIEQSIDRCPDCEALLTIRERIAPFQWNVVFRLTRQEHNVECPARDRRKARAA